MKRILLLLCILIFVGNIKAQKFAYVDSQFILEHIPEYKQAKQELDNISYQWQEEIENAYQDIDKLYRAYQTDKVLLTDKMRQDREDEIIQKEKDVKNFNSKDLGPMEIFIKNKKSSSDPFKISFIIPFKNMLNKVDMVLFLTSLVTY